MIADLAPAWLICSSLVLPDSCSFPACSARGCALPSGSSALLRARTAPESLMLGQLLYPCPAPGSWIIPAGSRAELPRSRRSPGIAKWSPWSWGCSSGRFRSEGSGARRFPGCGMAAEGRGNLINKSGDFASPALLPHAWRLKGGIESSQLGGCCRCGAGPLPGVLPAAEFRWEEMGRRHPADNAPLEVSSADVLPPHQHSRSALRLLPSCPAL